MKKLLCILSFFIITPAYAFTPFVPYTQLTAAQLNAALAEAGITSGTITGATIDNSAIGSTTPSTGNFTALSINGAALASLYAPISFSQFNEYLGSSTTLTTAQVQGQTYLNNTGSQVFTLPTPSTGYGLVTFVFQAANTVNSGASNYFIYPDGIISSLGANLSFPAYSSATFVYQNGSGKWQIISQTGNPIIANATAANQAVAYGQANNAYQGINSGYYGLLDTAGVNPLAASATITVGSSPLGIAYAPSSNSIYVTNINSNNVSVINPATNTVTATITVGTNPYGIAYAPSSNSIYVANNGSNNVSVINPATNTVTATITVGTNPYGIAYAPSSNSIYVANHGSNNVSVINPATNTVTATITVGSSPLGIAYAPSSNSIYVANINSNNVSVINPATNTVTATITVGSSPNRIAYAPSSNSIYVANYGSNNVSVINPATNTVTATITVGSSPLGIAYAPSSNSIYVANYGSNNVSVINPATNTVTATITVGSGPYEIAYAPSSNSIYVTNINSNTVSVIKTPFNGSAYAPLNGTASQVFSAANIVAGQTVTITNPVSGTVYQNTNPFAIAIYEPVTYNATGSAAATDEFLMGSTNSPSEVFTNSEPATSLAGIVQTDHVTIPPGWYYEWTLANATLGTPTAIAGLR
ncbi:MAG: YncE family protein [Pseudomonadota bacterium]|nr:YncE family protein [Pseudomonadota bacterium]